MAFDPNLTVTIFFDGGTRPSNPGPSVGAAVLYDENGQTLRHVAEFRPNETNNAAEALGLVLGLRAARDMGATHIRVRGDSSFIVDSFVKKWGCKNPVVVELLKEAREIAEGFETKSIKQVPRKLNGAADAVCNLVFRGEYAPDIDLEDAMSKVGKVQQDDAITFKFLVEMTVAHSAQAAFLALPDSTRRKALNHFSRMFENELAGFAKAVTTSVEAKVTRVAG